MNIIKFNSGWQSAELPQYSMPEVENVSGAEINFVDMPNATQTRIRILSTTKLEMNNPDFFPVLWQIRFLAVTLIHI